MNEKTTPYTVSPYVHGKTADKICRTCKYCQKIQSNIFKCKCSKHNSWETFDINSYFCNKYYEKTLI